MLLLLTIFYILLAIIYLLGWMSNIHIEKICLSEIMIHYFLNHPISHKLCKNKSIIIKMFNWNLIGLIQILLKNIFPIFLIFKNVLQKLLINFLMILINAYIKKLSLLNNHLKLI